MSGGLAGFRVGNLVRWTSSSHGVWRSHVGIVVAVVPAGEMPYHHRPAGGRWIWCCRDNTARAHDSYLVALKERGGRIGKLYRPRVRHLRHFTAGQDVVVEALRRSGRALLRSESRALVPYRPKMTARDRRIYSIAAPIVVALLWLIVAGMPGG